MRRGQPARAALPRAAAGTACFSNRLYDFSHVAGIAPRVPTGKRARNKNR